MIDLNIPLAGLERSAVSLNQAARKIASIGGSPEGDSVDLSAEAVAMIEARNSYQANAKVVKTFDDMSKQLLNELG